MTNDAATLDAARRELNLSCYELWVLFIGVGGHGNAFDLRSHLAGNRDLGDRGHNTLTLALNEAFADIGADHPLRYRHP